MAGTNDLKIQIIGTLNQTASLAEINRAIAQLETKINRININIQINEQAQNTLNNLNQQLQNLSSNANRNIGGNINSQLNSIGNSARQASVNVDTFGESFKNALSKITLWMGASTVFFQFTHFFQNGISFVNDLNSALTQISIVTGQNQQEVEALGQQYNQLAQSMSVTTKDVADASVEFYRQGLSQEEVMKRVKVATEYAKISNLDFKTSAEILTATTNSMNVSIERASDVFSYLGDATATGADEIGKAMQKVGGTAGALQIPFEKVSSWIAVVSSKTRESAETVGQGIKSILARVQSLKEKGFDSTDGTSVNQVSKALNAVGIQLMDSSGQFRNFSTVLDELGAKWNTLDSRQKAYIATTVNLSAA
jgi:TP901 family phage tail tape measure protein